MILGGPATPEWNDSGRFKNHSDRNARNSDHFSSNLYAGGLEREKMKGVQENSIRQI